MNNTISVVLITDNAFVMPTCITIVSLLHHKKDETRYEVNVVTPGLSQQNENILKSLANEQCSVTITKADMARFEHLHKDENSPSHLAATKAALLKFDLPNIFSDKDRILYIDGDIIVRGDVSPLFQTELGEHYLAAAHDTGKLYSKNQNVLKYPGYFNSGVMLLNLKKLREVNATSLLIQAKAAIKGKSLMDQPAFNEVCAKHVLHIHSKWNYLAINLERAGTKWNIKTLNSLINENYRSKQQFLNDAVIIHYSSKDKPWKTNTGKWTDLWFKYYQLSPYAKIKLPWQKKVFFTKALFSVTKNGCYREISILGIGFRYKSFKLKIQCKINELSKKIEQLEQDISLLS